jgi:hypothetical protein
MYYKSDWDKAKENLKAFWQGEDIGRPCMAVFAPRTDSSPSFPELKHGPWTGSIQDIPDNDTEAIKNWWTDPKENLGRMQFWFEKTYFGGEAVPATYINWGASAAAAFWGSVPDFRKTSVWYSEVIRDWETWKWEFNEKTNPWWKTIWDITAYLTENAKDKFMVGMPEFGDAADNLSIMRGMDNLATDCIDCPEKIEAAIAIMDAVWVHLHEKLYQLTLPVNEGGGVLPWMSLWAPGRIDQLACDFSSVLSPGIFRDIFVKDIETMGSWTEYGMYHLDGPSCMKNMLDVLLEIRCIKAIEFTPGAGSPPTLTKEYIPRYKKILENGRKLYLLADPKEVEPLCRELPSKGLYLCTFADSKRDADLLIESTYLWSKGK